MGETNKTKKWIIEGVKVYEGHGYPFKLVPDDDFNLIKWTDAGTAAYKTYVEENGKPDLVHAHGRFLAAGVLALRLKVKFGHPFVYTEHSSRFPAGYVPAGSIPMLNEVIDECSLYISVSNQLMKKVEETLDRHIVKAVVVPNVIDDVFTKQLKAAVQTDPLNFSVVANLEHRKGIDILLRAFKKAFHGEPQYQLHIAGDGPELRELEQLRNYLGLDKTVHFLGQLSKEGVLELLDRTHVFVLPSRFETFGVAIIEAMARGCPVISTICGGPESIVPVQFGILVKPDNEDVLHHALNTIVNNYSLFDRELIRTYALSRFGPETFVQTMEMIYAQYGNADITLQPSTVTLHPNVNPLFMEDAPDEPKYQHVGYGKGQ